MHRWSRAGWTLAGTTLLLGSWACDTKSADEGSQNIADPQAFEAAAKHDLVPIVEGIDDGMRRVLVASAGGASDGVTITPTQTGANVTILVDFDGNGTREGTINSAITGDIATGAGVSIGSVTGKDNSLIVGGGMTATETSPGMILLDNISGSGATDPPGSRNAATVDVTDGAVTLDAAAGVPGGFVDMHVSGEGNSLGVTLTFVPDGNGGFSIHVTGNGLDFTIP